MPPIPPTKSLAFEIAPPILSTKPLIASIAPLITFVTVPIAVDTASEIPLKIVDTASNKP